MITKAKVNWLGEGYKLEGITDNGMKVLMDTGDNSVSASPAQLLLQSLAGCTMMDCVLIISKSRKKLEKFWVEVEAVENETHPKIFSQIQLTYHFKGSELDEATVERAIKLSEEKYCRVHAMLAGKSNITSSYKLIK
ncbi:MAG TPA: OsmC family protein [Ignavibacteria bacterium]|nr:OsmC family protein [Ignavibacteria bacterium]